MLVNHSASVSHFQRFLGRRAGAHRRRAGLAVACLLLAARGAGAQQAPGTGGEPPIASDAAADSLLLEVTTLAPGVRVELRYATRNNFTGAVLPGYEGNRAYLRREAAQALARVEQRLETEGLGLKIWDGYRPVRASEEMVAWAERAGRTDLLDGYVARRSRHNLGLAVDLTLVELASGRELEMGTPYDTFSEAAHTSQAEGAVREHRQRLVRAMEAEGFRNYAQEWWHFSYEVPAPVAFDRVIR